MIDILLAVYNGEKYLEAQLESIISQTYTNWEIIARDDGSTDNTFSILETYAQRFNNKFKIIKDEKKNLGVCQNFATLISHSNSDYIMFCDQDDIWLPEKIQVTLDKMIAIEKKTPEKPVLIHTDLYVVDEHLNIISDSMWQYQNLDIGIEKNIYKIAVHPIVTGCTVMINKAAKYCSGPIPKQALMHDWWISIHVCKYGIIDHVSQSTILYRQHSNNKNGAIKKNLHYYLKRISNIWNFSEDDYSFIQMIKVLDFKLEKKCLFKHTLIIIFQSFFYSIVPRRTRKNDL